MAPLEQLEGAATDSAAFPQRIPRNPVTLALRPYLHEVPARKWLATRSVRDDARHEHMSASCVTIASCAAMCIPDGWCGKMKLRKAQGGRSRNQRTCE